MGAIRKLCRFIVANSTDRPRKGRGQGHVTHFQLPIFLKRLNLEIGIHALKDFEFCTVVGDMRFYWPGMTNAPEMDVVIVT